MTRHDRPILIAIDGASGSGKSTLALRLGAEFNAALVHSDDFFAAGISNAEWDARTPEERTADAISLEHAVIAGLAPAEPGVDALVEELAENLRALLRDMICGHLDLDVRAVADELLQEAVPAPL